MAGRQEAVEPGGAAGSRGRTGAVEADADGGAGGVGAGRRPAPEGGHREGQRSVRAAARLAAATSGGRTSRRRLGAARTVFDSPVRRLRNARRPVAPHVGSLRPRPEPRPALAVPPGHRAPQARRRRLRPALRPRAPRRPRRRLERPAESRLRQFHGLVRQGLFLRASPFPGRRRRPALVARVPQRRRRRRPPDRRPQRHSCR
mmetsp:Transcript_3661/g.11321  ORF Transcript_3661/g.11321 Transcript_3661/m.11321 type:complete len:203 (-) Transcript_3661:121-729(-)